MLVLVCTLSLQGAYSQEAKTDSLQAVLDTARNERKVKTLNELSRAYITSDPIKALGFTREALSLATEINDQKGMAASYNNLGVAYRNHGALDKALEYYLTSLRIYQTLENKEGVATTKNNISNIYAIKKDFGQAMRYLEESHNLFLELNDPKKIIGSMNNLGNLHSEIKLNEKAMKYFSESAQLAEKIGVMFADPYTNMGNLYFKQDQYEKAIELYEKALAMERGNNNKLGILNIITNLGIVHTRSGNYGLATQYFDEAIALCNSIEAYAFLPSIYKSIGENFAKQNKWKEAYESQRRYDEAREKIYGEESSRNIAQMEMILEFQKKEKEYEMLKQEDEIKTLQLRNSRLFILMVILVVLIILGGLNFYYLTKKKVIKKPRPVV